MKRRIALAALLFCAQAHAEAPREPTAGDLATARTALVEGLALRERGEIEQARERLQTAYDLVATPVTAFELGKTHLLAGHVLLAHELFRKVERMPRSLEESSRSETARLEAEKLAREVEPRIPTLRIRVRLPKGATATVKVDDEIVQTHLEATPRAVDPGRHDVTAKAGDGPEQKITLTIGESEIRDVELAPPWMPPKVVTPSSSLRVITLKETNPLAIVGFTAASASLVLTSLALYWWEQKKSEAKAKCGADYCPQSVIDHEGRQADLWGGLSLGGVLTTVGALSVGIFGLMTPAKEKVQAYVGPTGGGVSGRF